MFLRCMLTIGLLGLPAMAFGSQCRLYPKVAKIDTETGKGKSRGFYAPHNEAPEIIETETWEDCYQAALTTLYGLAVYEPYKYSPGYCQIDIGATGDDPVDPSLCRHTIYQMHVYVYWNFDDMVGPFFNSWGHVNAYTDTYLREPAKKNQAFSSRGERIEALSGAAWLLRAGIKE